MQEAAHAAIRQRESVLLLSPTGSGKTLAYLLPLIERVEEKIDALQAVVVVPGRELAIQVERVLREQSTVVRAMALYGGTSHDGRASSLARVATPCSDCHSRAFARSYR